MSGFFSRAKLFAGRVSIRAELTVQFLEGNSALAILFSGWFVLVRRSYWGMDTD